MIAVRPAIASSPFNAGQAVPTLAHEIRRLVRGDAARGIRYGIPAGASVSTRVYGDRLRLRLLARIDPAGSFDDGVECLLDYLERDDVVLLTSLIVGTVIRVGVELDDPVLFVASMRGRPPASLGSSSRTDETPL